MATLRRGRRLDTDVRFGRILLAARKGDSQAWENIYRDLAPLVLGYLRSRGSREPEDLAGEVFVALVKNLPRFEGDERAFRTWVLTIAHRRLVDEFRRAARSIEEEFDSNFPAEARRSGDVEAEALDRLGAGRVRGLLASLSQDQQEVLLLRIIGDQTVEEVAKILGKRPGAVKALQRRGLASLRRKLEQPVPLGAPQTITEI